jgi:adenine-specific DNA-methyltransferase
MLTIYLPYYDIIPPGHEGLKVGFQKHSGKYHWNTGFNIMTRPVNEFNIPGTTKQQDARTFHMSGDACGLTWPGKQESLNEAFMPASGELVQVSGKNFCIENMSDVFIEGDNLAVLKILEQEFAGRVRFIYIDPPYNTGKQFTYRDHFRGLNRGNRSRNHHQPWLSMMFPRLEMAKRMLAEDGVMYVSIDDTELHNLVMLMDEVFGEENRAGIITWVKKKKGSHLSKTLRSMTEYILVYGRDITKLDLYGEDAYTHKWQPLVKRINKEKTLTFEGGVVETTLKNNFYPAGIYGTGGTAVELLDDIHIREDCITNRFSMKARTVWVQKKLDEEIAMGTRVSIRSEGMGPNVFRHNQLEKKKCPPTFLDGRLGFGTNEDAWNELRKIFKTENVYSYPKPVSLIKYLVNTISKQNPDGIFLDFFAGSGTTGQAVWEANREDGGTRKFILVQTPEPMIPPVVIDNGKKIDTISQLCLERLDRVSEGESLSVYRLK